MNKKFILGLLILVLFVYFADIFTTQPKVDPIPSPVPVVVPKELAYEEVVSLIKSEDVKSYVEILASKEFNGRGTGSEGNDKAREYIKKHLDILGILYKEQEFSAKGKTTKNIIAYIVPKNIKNDEIIVIGAHFDHLGGRGDSYYPGADDNGSGTAGLMAIATALSKYKDRLNHVVLLQFYSAEEMGLLGSKYYTDHPLFPENDPDINKHIAMINMDMIGYLKKKYDESENMTDYRVESDYVDEGIYGSVDLKGIVSELSSKYNFATNIAGYKPGGSDHSPFLSKKIPAVFLHTGTHPYYHKPTDTPDRLNYTGLARVAQLALEILVSIDKIN